MFWYRVVEWFNDMSERHKLIRDFNKSAKVAFIEGLAPTLLASKITKGYVGYRHSYSKSMSGFRVQAFTGRPLSKNDLIQIGAAIMSNSVLVRKLVVLGFDTLEVAGDIGDYGCRWQLKDYMQLTE